MFTITKAGTFTITATMSGNDNYNDVTSAEFTLTVEKTPSSGLSGGAIAGIVIGSVLLAGIGGFVIFWFVIKKRTFTQLGAAIKGLWNKFIGLFKKKTPKE